MSQVMACPKKGVSKSGTHGFFMFFPTEAGSAQSWSCLSNPIVSSHATQRHQARGIWTRMTWDNLGPDLCEIHLNTINTYKYWDSGIFSFFMGHTPQWPCCRRGVLCLWRWFPDVATIGAGRWSWCHGCGRRVMCRFSNQGSAEEEWYAMIYRSF